MKISWVVIFQILFTFILFSCHRIEEAKEPYSIKIENLDINSSIIDTIWFTGFRDTIFCDIEVDFKYEYQEWELLLVDYIFSESAAKIPIEIVENKVIYYRIHFNDFTNEYYINYAIDGYDNFYFNNDLFLSLSKHLLEDFNPSDLFLYDELFKDLKGDTVSFISSLYDYTINRDNLQDFVILSDYLIQSNDTSAIKFEYFLNEMNIDSVEFKHVIFPGLKNSDSSKFEQ